MTTTGSTPQALDASWPRDAVSVRTVAQQVVLSSYERSALTLEEYAAKVVAFAESSQERNRRRGIRKRIDICRDAWGPALKARLENWCVPAVVDAVIGTGRDHLDLSRNPAKNIWQELSTVYDVPPTRTTPENTSDGERYLELLKGTGFDLYWQDVEFYLNACNEVLVWPDVIERDGVKVIKHRYACGDVAVIVTKQEDPTEIECVLIIDEYTSLDGVSHTQYRLWTADWHAQFERNPEGDLQRTGYVNPALVPEDGDPAKDASATNPYGMLPMYLVRLHAWGDSIWDPTSGEDLVDLTLCGGEERAFYRYSQKMGGFKQGMITGQGIEKPPQQLLDPGALLMVEGQNIQTTIVDWQLDLKARLECMNLDELAAAASRGINPERYKHSGNYQSGHGAQLAERGLAKATNRRRMILAEAEKTYKRNACTVWAAHQVDNPPDPEVDLEVMYAPQAYPEAPDMQIGVDEKEIALGLESAVSILMRRHPDWTEEQARDALKARMEDNAWVAEQKATRKIADNPEAQTRTAEQFGRQGPPARDGEPQSGPPPEMQQGDRE